MSTNISVNSKQYWDYRFKNDWNNFDGKQQTKFFANLIINNLPHFIKEILNNGVKVCDIGCAEGQAVEEYSLKYPNCKVVGIDFSNQAIHNAKELYPDNDFFCLDIQNLNFKNDILISSNTLEHFLNPYPIIDSLLSNTSKHLILLLPFQENKSNMANEHHYRFDFESFPLVINDFVLSFHKIIDCSKINRGKFWNGSQILIIYSKISELQNESLKSIKNDDCYLENPTNKHPKIFIGAPVRNRAWILPRYIEGLLKQKVNFETCFIVNDSVDNTEQILKENGFDVYRYNLDSNYGERRGEYSKKNLALLRNVLLDEFLKSDCDYLFSVDTDIILPEGSLQQLINHDKDIVSMIIKNSPVLMAHNIFVDGKHIEEVPEGLISVDMTGAVYLIKRSVIEAGVRYGMDVLGEDIPFCRTAKQLGFEIFCDTRLKPIHVFDDGIELIAETKRNIITINSLIDVNVQILELIDMCEEGIKTFVTLIKKGQIKESMEILQDIIDSLNKVGSTMKKELINFMDKQMELKFNKIDKNIGQIFELLNIEDYDGCIKICENNLYDNFLMWKNYMRNCLIIKK
ncbi:methyltransferase domain-containing protein [Fictibacillus halophilus]|uniref:methyltransferase domain-containing protein n=1 Tax=Fictibacillus halophilus TaxID=1610490 RepID=UPI00362D223E